MGERMELRKCLRISNVSYYTSIPEHILLHLYT